MTELQTAAQSRSKPSRLCPGLLLVTIERPPRATIRILQLAQSVLESQSEPGIYINLLVIPGNILDKSDKRFRGHEKMKNSN
jgi:hypothetical protein